MAYKNSVRLGGNLTKDPEVRSTQGGKTVAEFGLAVSKPGKAEPAGADYFTVACFGKLAETVADQKKKGHAVVVEGEILYSSWEDRESGQRRSRTIVKADDVQFVDTVGNGTNHVLLIGNITRDPEVRTVETAAESEVPVCNFGLAINRIHSRAEDAVDFVDVDVWREQGEAVHANKTKGEGVMVEGRLRYESWEDRESGQRRSKVKVVADSVQFTTSKKATNPTSGSARTHRGSASRSAKPAYGSRNGNGAGGGGDDAPATNSQIDRLKREAVAAAGEDGVAKLQRRLGKELSDLTKKEASGHIDKFVQAKKVTA